jgi:RNA polymerase-binding transcription factor DksA
MAKTTDRTAKPAAKAGAASAKNVAAKSGKAKDASSASRPAVKLEAKSPKVGKDSGSRTAAKAAPAVYVCPFSKDELAKWRLILVERRSEISDDIGALEKDAMEAEDGHTTPNHIAERGSDADLQDISLNIAGDEKILIWQIDRALRKIDVGMPIPFGICEHTRQQIPKSRLQLIPWTPLSIEGAEHCEQNGMTIEDVLIDD